MASRIRLHEVSPRDGLQNEPDIVSTDHKVALIERLVGAGFQDIEVTSFVSPRFIPQLADATEVVRRLPRTSPSSQAPPGQEGVRYWALVPNPVGLERALESGISHIATFMSASETHNQKNVNRTIRESLAGLRKVIETAVAENLRVRSYISTVFGCPYEGDVAVEKTLEIALALRAAGAHEIALGDTTGMADPEQVKRVIAAVVAAGIPLEDIACHFHDTRGTALVNAYAAWQVGITTFDGSIAGIGGCPYAPGAAGNAATEDLIHMFQRVGCEVGVDLERACEAGVFMEQVLGRPLQGRYHQYWLGQQRRRMAREARAQAAGADSAGGARSAGSA
jgi:hydroxymethylglutaryl-CoA lyase